MISDLDDSSELHVDAEVQTEIESLEKGTNTEVQTGIEKATNTINYITDQPLTALGKEVSGSCMYPVSQKELKENSNKLKYYTGLPSYSIFMVIYNFVSPFIASHGHMQCLTKIAAVFNGSNETAFELRRSRS